MPSKIPAELKPPTLKELRFLDEYWRDLNGSAAYRRLYPEASANYAKVYAHKILHRVHIVAYLEDHRKHALDQIEFLRTRLVEELKALALANLDDFSKLHSDGSRTIDFTKVTREQMASVSEMVVDEYTEGLGDDARKVKRTKVKLVDKPATIERLMKHLGMIVEKLEITGKDGGPIKHEGGSIKDMTDAELEAELRQLHRSSGDVEG